jgi:Spy/CpxP family protein refolding chaperone
MESSKLSFWKIFAITLLISNMVILAFIFFEKPTRANNKGPSNFIIKELNLNAAQIENFNQLKFAHQDSVQSLKNTGRELREDYFKLLRNDTTDNILADQLLIQIANNQKAIEQITFEHFQSVKNICDSVQKDKFDSIILEVIHKMKDNRPKPNRPEPNR